MRLGANLRPGVRLFPGGHVILYGKSRSRQRWLGARATSSTWGLVGSAAPFGRAGGRTRSSYHERAGGGGAARVGGRGPLLAAARSSCIIQSVAPRKATQQCRISGKNTASVFKEHLRSAKRHRVQQIETPSDPQMISSARGSQRCSLPGSDWLLRAVKELDWQAAHRAALPFRLPSSHLTAW